MSAAFGSTMPQGGVTSFPAQLKQQEPLPKNPNFQGTQGDSGIWHPPPPGQRLAHMQQPINNNNNYNYNNTTTSATPFIPHTQDTHGPSSSNSNNNNNISGHNSFFDEMEIGPTTTNEYLYQQEQQQRQQKREHEDLAFQRAKRQRERHYRLTRVYDPVHPPEDDEETRQGVALGVRPDYAGRLFRERLMRLGRWCSLTGEKVDDPDSELREDEKKMLDWDFQQEQEEEDEEEYDDEDGEGEKKKDTIFTMMLGLARRDHQGYRRPRRHRVPRNGGKGRSDMVSYLRKRNRFRRWDIKKRRLTEISPDEVTSPAPGASGGRGADDTATGDGGAMPVPVMRTGRMTTKTTTENKNKWTGSVPVQSTTREAAAGPTTGPPKSLFAPKMTGGQQGGGATGNHQATSQNPANVLPIINEWNIRKERNELGGQSISQFLDSWGQHKEKKNDNSTGCASMGSNVAQTVPYKATTTNKINTQGLPPRFILPNGKANPERIWIEQEQFIKAGGDGSGFFKQYPGLYDFVFASFQKPQSSNPRPPYTTPTPVPNIATTTTTPTPAPAPPRVSNISIINTPAKRHPSTITSHPYSLPAANKVYYPNIGYGNYDDGSNDNGAYSLPAANKVHYPNIGYGNYDGSNDDGGYGHSRQDGHDGNVAFVPANTAEEAKPVPRSNRSDTKRTVSWAPLPNK